MRRRVWRQVSIVVALGWAALLLFAACGGGSAEQVPAPRVESDAPVRQDAGPRSDSSTIAPPEDRDAPPLPTAPPPASAQPDPDSDEGTPVTEPATPPPVSFQPDPDSDEGTPVAEPAASAPEAAGSPRALEEEEPEALPEPPPIPIWLRATVVEDGTALHVSPMQPWLVRETLAAGATVRVARRLGKFGQGPGIDELPPHWLLASTEDGVRGWIEITSLDLTPEDAAALPVGWVERLQGVASFTARALIDGLNYRGEPRLDGEVLGQLQRGLEMRMRGRSPDGQWVLVLVSEAGTGINAGWVYAANPDWLEVSVPVPELPVTLGYGLFVVALPQGPGDSVGDPVRIPSSSSLWFPNEPRLIYTQSTGSGVLVRSYDARTGEHTDLFVSDGSLYSISPDGRYLATLSGLRTEYGYEYLVQLRDWAGRVLAEAPLQPCPCDSPFPRPRNIQWAPDSSALLVWDSEHLPLFVGGERVGPISILHPGGYREEIGVGSAPRWTPDGAVVWGHPEGERWRWESGSLSAIKPREDVDLYRSVVPSANRQWLLYYESPADIHDDPWQVDLLFVHLETGRIVHLTRTFSGGSTISDDGGFLAITRLPASGA